MTLALDGVIFDLDGTVYLGNEALPGAVETITFLRRHGIRTLYVTNKPLQSRMNYAEKLTHLGIPTPVDEVITSSYVLGYHLTVHHPDLTYFVIGEKPLLDELREFGLNIVNNFDDQDPKEVVDVKGIDAVIVAFDRTLDYLKLNIAYQSLKLGARFFATNADKTCPVPGGGIPDAGGVIVALEHMTGRKLELLAGKPSTLMMEVTLDKIGLKPEQCMMVGDRLETDIFMGQNAGMLTALVLTGVATRQDVVQLNSPPDYVLENIGEIPRVVFGGA